MELAAFEPGHCRAHAERNNVSRASRSRYLNHRLGYPLPMLQPVRKG